MRQLREFWHDGSHRTAPGWPLGITRILIGAFWLSQIGHPPAVPGGQVLIALAGASLAMGLLTRVGAVLGIGLSVMIGQSSLQPAWPIALLVIVHALLMATSSGQNLGLDQMLMQRVANWPYRRSSWVRRLMALL